MPDWSERKYEPLGFPKRYNAPGLSRKEREQRYRARRRWRMKRDASFREAEMAKRSRQALDRQKHCHVCGKAISHSAKRCTTCHNTERARAATKPERLWLELSTPYHNGDDAQHEGNIQRLNQIAKENPL